MADTVSATPAVAAASPAPAKKSASKAGGARAKPSHPKTSDMVNNAIKNLKERGGSSLQAIKKYIAANYKVDSEKQAPFIKKYLKSAVTSGILVQTKGKGASGSFKLAVKQSASTAGDAGKGASKAKRSPKEKKTTAKSAAASKSKKSAASAAGKKASSSAAAAKTAKKASAVKKSPAKSKPSSPSKAKKAAKGPTRKPKAPKPKKATAKGAVKSSPKKAAPKKK